MKNIKTDVLEIRGTSLDEDHPLAAAFGEWVNLMADPTWRGNDCPWWYNERASISQFAGAIWRTGGWVLEEFSGTKKAEDQTKFKGRVDLMFWTTRNRGGPRFIAEAKPCWSSLRSSFAERHVTKAIDKALTDVEKDRDYGGGYFKLGMAFAAPSIPKRFSAQTPILVERLIKRLRAEPDLSLAWYFRITDDMPHHAKRFYPGVILGVRGG